jgi:hypothetical protein
MFRDMNILGSIVKAKIIACFRTAVEAKNWIKTMWTAQNHWVYGLRDPTE